MKKIITPLIIVLVLAGLSFFAFSKFKSGEIIQDPMDKTSVSEKQGTTTKTGKITTENGNYFLTEAGKVPELIETMTVDLSAYVGKTVTVEGKYSGDTLFVGSVK